jgi:hypothetical protein
LSEDDGEDEGVERAPGVELAAVEGEAVRGRPECQAGADNAALLVGLQIRKVGEHFPDLAASFVRGIGAEKAAEELAT